jgi:tripartite-type tricarboxylate transporter receptor subunit TctC
VAPYVEKYFKQPFLVVNKPGGGAILGTTMLAKAKPDGYTLGQISSYFAGAFLFHDNLEFAADSFESICGIVKVCAFFVVRADAPWKTLQEFVSEAKKNPGRLRYSTQGFACAYHLAGTDFCGKAGIKLTHIPQPGVGDVISQLMGKHVEMGVVATTLGHLPAGRLRALAVATEKRLEAFPAIPTMAELGYPVHCEIHTGHVVPRGTPKRIKEKLSRGYLESLRANEKAFTAAFMKLDEFLAILEPDEYTEVTRRDTEAQMRYKGMKLE